MPGLRGESFALLRRDAVTGNWTVPPNPEPGPSTHPSKPAQHGPPYASTLAVMGGVPTLTTDIPIAAVLLALFVASAAAHMAIFQKNKRFRVKFLFSGMMFAVCFLRSVALCMRIVWATHPRVANIAIAAGILTQTGSVIVFIINLILAQRILRGYHPKFGWRPAVNWTFHFLVACVVATLIMAIAVTIQSFFTLDAATRRADRLVQLFAGTYMALLAFLPLPIVALAALLPRANTRVEKFGSGRWRTKVWLLLFTSALATLGASFRVYTGYVPRPASNPAWYHSRACYYCFNFIIDLIISAAYLFLRFDRRYIVPNGAKGPGDYGKGLPARPPSVASSDGGEELGNDTDPEKLARLRDGDKSKEEGKGKDRDINLESDDKPAMSIPSSASAVDNGTQTPYGAGGDWYPWPFRASWAMPRHCEPIPSLGDHPNGGDDAYVESPDDNYSLDDGPLPHPNIAGIEETAGRWGGGVSNARIQDPDSRMTERQFYIHQLQHGRPHIFGQAYTANEALHADISRQTEHNAVWPTFIGETHAFGGGPVTSGPSRSRTVAVHGPASSSRAPSRGAINRSMSCKEAEIRNPTGGWM
ncbi:hypothetical protein F4859DRAFT_509433 [Xylaria cf. heliscus]|nr:hypothetical protein F4859DRAFT_509433 [Xylaria cf. heliscus]